MLAFLLIASFLSAACGELSPIACLQGELQKCAKTVGNGFFLPNCPNLWEMEKCLKNAAKICKFTDIEADLNAFLQTQNDLCDPSSDLFKELSKSHDCLDKYGKTLEGSTCIKKLRELYESKDPLEAKVLKLSKEICETQSTVLKCLYGEVEKACKKEAKDAVATVVRPLSNLLTKSCKESGFEDRGGGAGTSALSWALLVVASLLFVLWH